MLKDFFLRPPDLFWFCSKLQYLVTFYLSFMPGQTSAHCSAIVGLGRLDVRDLTPASREVASVAWNHGLPVAKEKPFRCTKATRLLSIFNCCIKRHMFIYFFMLACYSFQGCLRKSEPWHSWWKISWHAKNMAFGSGTLCLYLFIRQEEKRIFIF